MACPHNRVVIDADVNKLASDANPDVEDANQWVLDVRVRCAGCDESFAFRGLPHGLSFRQPMASPDGLELRAPLVSPAEQALHRMVEGR